MEELCINVDECVSSGFSWPDSDVSEEACAELESSFRWRAPSPWALKRRWEFLLGRIAAQKSFSQLGLEVGLLAAGHQREVLWPEGYSGSISHDANSVICVVRQGSKPIGIDCENLMDPLMANDLAEIVGSKSADPTLVTLIFSAKEAVYKAFYPLYKRILDFHEVDLSVSNGNERFQFCIPSENLKGHGRYWFVNEKIYTFVDSRDFL